MTEQQEEITFPEIPVQFRGREIYARMPRPEQLLVWQRVVKSLTEAPPGVGWTGQEVMGALERLRKIVDSILLNKADIQWIDDEFLEGTLTFQDLAPLITLVTEAYAKAAEEQAPNREAKRAVKKAARKKVVK